MDFIHTQSLLFKYLLIMTKEEIKTLISAKVAGQGNQVDSGGALDAILNAIVDSIPEGGGSGAPVLKITLVDASGKQFDNIAFTGLAPSVTQRTVSFAVEGQTVQSVSLSNTTDVADYIEATSDGEGGFVATIPGKTATYFIEAVLADDSVVSGILFMLKATE